MDKRTLRYRTIRNRTGDVKLARKARSWSDERILKELAIVIPKRKPKLKPITKSRQSAYQLELKKYKYLLDKGIKTDKAKRLMKKNWQTVKSKEPGRVDYESYFNKETDPEGRLSRKKQWSIWSKYANLYKKTRDPKYLALAFPNWIKNLVSEINIRASKIASEKGFTQVKFDKNSSYGWAVMYEAYLSGQPISFWESIIEIDRWDADLYKIKRTSL